MSSLGEKLKKLRQGRNETQKKLAEVLQVTERNYQGYEYDKVKPPYDALLVLANYYDTSLDYLLGKTEDPRADSIDYIGDSVLGYGVNPISDLLNAAIRIRDAQSDAKEKEKWEIRLGTLMKLIREHEAAKG